MQFSLVRGNTTSRPLPSGEEIALEVEREMETHLYRLRYTLKPPAQYYVYLHPDDFRRLEPLVPEIIQDVQKCLNARVASLNARVASFWAKVKRQRPRPIEPPPRGWVIHVRPAVNQELQQGDIGIHSHLALPMRPRFRGQATVRVFQTIVSGTGRTTRRLEATAADPFHHETQAFSGPPVGSPGRITTAEAHLDISDRRGQRACRLNKDLVKIGRGGAEHWVDIVVVASDRVSREHCRIRRDVNGGFFLQDVSQWGTTVDGARLQQFHTSKGTSVERELSDGATIRLADEVTLTFHVS